MAEPQARNVVQVQEWPGLFTNTGPMSGDSPPGNAVVQTNLRVNVPGELAARPGFTKVLFDEE